MSTYGDGEPCAVYEEELRKARKEHRCHACSEPITPGRTYHRTFLIFEGDPRVTVRCERCQAIYEHLTERMKEDGTYGDEFCDGELNCGHTYQDRWEEPPPEAIAALAFWLPGDPLPGAPSA